jgi:hypothetical protein
MATGSGVVPRISRCTACDLRTMPLAGSGLRTPATRP